MNHFRTFVAVILRGLLGAFVLWQIVYLFGSLLFNLEEAFGVRSPRLENVVPESMKERPWLRALNELDQNGFRWYGELTHQPQNWSLFAPEVAEEFAFFDVELLWDDETTVILRAKNEPEDINAFVRLSGFRLRKYEGFLTPTPAPYEVMFGDGEPSAYRVYEQADHMLAYLRWRLAEFRRVHPDRPPPSEVALWMHMYRIPKPPGPQPWQFEDADIVCLGRWLPESGQGDKGTRRQGEKGQ